MILFLDFEKNLWLPVMEVPRRGSRHNEFGSNFRNWSYSGRERNVLKSVKHVQSSAFQVLAPVVVGQ